MKKLKTLMVAGAAGFLLAGCFNNPSKDVESESKAGSKTSQVSQSTSASASKSSGGAASKSNSASTSKSTSSVQRQVPSTVAVTKKDKPYHIFDKVPEIKFTFDGTDKSWATTPSRTTEKPEQAGFVTTSSIDGVKGLELEPAGMKVRGNYTSTYQKKPFRLKFNSKTNVFGLNEGKKFKKWVLLADVKDSSMLRNASAFYLATQLMPSTVFTSDFTPVHVYINEEYWGMYLLAEQKEVKDGRVPIYEAKATDTGTDIGYFFELDNYWEEEAQKADGDPTFTVQYKPQAINWHHPFENFTRIQNGYTMGIDLTNPDVQLPYIKKRVEMAYQILYNAVMNNKYQRIENEQVVDDNSTSAEECLAKTFDIDSFVSMYLLHELVCDPDVGYSSFFLSLDMSSKGNKKMTCNCPWDFDSTMGVRQSGDRSSQEGIDFSKNAQGQYVSKSSNMWLSLIYKLKFFQDAVKNKYNEAKAQGVFTKVAEMQDDYSASYVTDYAKNFQKWPRNMGNNPEVSHETVTDVNNFRTEAQAKTFLQNWYNKRVATVDGILNGTSGGGSGGDQTDPDFATFKQTATPTRLEAETATLGAGSKNPLVKTAQGENISGSYVGELDANQGASLTWTLNSNGAKQRVLFTAGLSARSSAQTFGNMFTLTVNGKEVTPADITIPAGTTDLGPKDYHYWTTVDVGYGALQNGSNSIVLTAKNVCTNFDYLDIFIPNA